MSDQATQLAAQRKDMKAVLSGESFKQAVQAALPAHLKPERFIRIAITALTRTPKLQSCTQESFFKCLLDLSAMGLEPDGRSAHLIPYGKECTLIVDYKGIVSLVRRSGDVSYIHCDVVYRGDAWDFKYGSGAFLEHKPKLDGDRKPENRIAVYSFVKLKDGSEDFMVWGMSQVEAIHQRSKSKDNGPWVTDYNEMAKKSVFRNHSKWLPLSSELRDQIERDDDAIDLEGSFELPEENGSRDAAGHAGVDGMLKIGDIEAAKRVAKDYGLDWAPYQARVDEVAKAAAEKSSTQQSDVTGGSQQKTSAPAEPSAPTGGQATEASATEGAPAGQTKLDPQQEAFAKNELLIKDLMKKLGPDAGWRIIGQDFSLQSIEDAARSKQFKQIVDAFDVAIADKKKAGRLKL